LSENVRDTLAVFARELKFCVVIQTCFFTVDCA
jgi:hypothetical protein